MTNFTKSPCKISIPVTLQCMLGMLFVGLIMSSRYGAKVRAFKQRIFMKNLVFTGFFLVLAVVRL